MWQAVLATKHVAVSSIDWWLKPTAAVVQLLQASVTSIVLFRWCMVSDLLLHTKVWCEKLRCVASDRICGFGIRYESGPDLILYPHYAKKNLIFVTWEQKQKKIRFGPHLLVMWTWLSTYLSRLTTKTRVKIKPADKNDPFISMCSFLSWSHVSLPWNTGNTFQLALIPFSFVTEASHWYLSVFSYLSCEQGGSLNGLR